MWKGHRKPQLRGMLHYCTATKRIQTKKRDVVHVEKHPTLVQELGRNTANKAEILRGQR